MSWAMRCLLDAVESMAILAGMVIVPWYIGKAGIWLIRLIIWRMSAARPYEGDGEPVHCEKVRAVKGAGPYRMPAGCRRYNRAAGDRPYGRKLHENADL